MLKRQKTTKAKPNLGQPKQEEGEEEDVIQNSVILVSSSDDEDQEANEDLSLEIVQKARMREAKRKRDGGFDEFKDSEGARSVAVIDLSSASSDDIEVVGEAAAAVATKSKKKRNRKKKSKMIEEEERTVGVAEAEKPMETIAPVESVANISEEAEGEGKGNAVEAVNIVKPEELQTETDGVQDNMRKYLRGPRYFDSPDCFLETCYNCNEEGHRAANCTSKKRNKPCFVCGSLDHCAKQCTQGLECYICKKKGHRKKDCPEKHQQISNNYKICLRCGDLGHDMFSCTNSYAPEDLKDIKCYVCGKVGHLCCVDFIDSTSGVVSCYNCGQPGHYGVGCAKQRGETSDTASGTSCYRCGELGHYARGCPKISKADHVMGDSSVPTKTKKLLKEARSKLGSQSAPNNLSKAGKKKMKKGQFDERELTTPKLTTPKKLKQRWVTDVEDPPNRKAKWNSWRSPGTTPTHKNHYYNQTNSGQFSNFHSPSNWTRFHPGTPSPNGQANSYQQHRFSASRFGHSAGGGAPCHW